MPRVGLGYDSHRFVAGRPLILGGVRVEHDMGLEGHSDADALLHAVIDAILGAAGLGDIGEQFPDGDEQFRDADSGKLLAQVIQWIVQRGLRVTNCDATVITQGPKLSPYKMAIRQRLAFALGLDIQSVNVKAKTNEGMGWIGRSEGLAAMAVVLLEEGPTTISVDRGQSDQFAKAGGPTEPVAEGGQAEPPPLPPPAEPGQTPIDAEGPSKEEIEDIEKTVGPGYCPRCGKRLGDEDRVCPKCGFVLSQGTGCLAMIVMFVMLLVGGVAVAS